MDTTRAELVTHKHIARVSALLAMAAAELLRRGAVHDASKFMPEEIEPLERMQDLIDREGQAQYGTPEYKRRTDMLGGMTSHHYARNSHHPEHYADGVAGMDLFDIVEMFFDWKAASERGEDSCMRLAPAFEKYQVSPQLAAIIVNTAFRLGYSTDTVLPKTNEAA